MHNKEVQAMYQQYRDYPRIDEAVPMRAQLHLQELHRQAAQVRLARLANASGAAAMPLLPTLVRHIRHALGYGTSLLCDLWRNLEEGRSLFHAFRSNRKGPRTKGKVQGDMPGFGAPRPEVEV